MKCVILDYGIPLVLLRLFPNAQDTECNTSIQRYSTNTVNTVKSWDEQTKTKLKTALYMQSKITLLQLKRIIPAIRLVNMKDEFWRVMICHHCSLCLVPFTQDKMPFMWFLVISLASSSLAGLFLYVCNKVKLE